MGSWDYKNIGASAEPQSKKIIGKIFDYLGYSSGPETSDGDECSFYPFPDVYRSRSGGDIDPEDEDVLYILNALFPFTKLYVHRAEGNNTSDTWENHDEIYDTEDMTWFAVDKYTDYGGWGPTGERSRKARFVLKPPESWIIEELIENSRYDGETELASLLEDLLQRLNDGLIVYDEDPDDKRKIGEEYDVIDNVTGSVDEEEADKYCQYVFEKMPYEKFIDLYKIVPDSLDEETYESVLDEAAHDCYEYGTTEGGPFDKDYDDFMEWVEDSFECKSELDEESYEAVRETVVKLFPAEE